MGKESKGVLLVVEDDSGLQRQLKWFFDEYEVIFATDQGSAIKQVRRFDPDVVLLDLGLPPHPNDIDIGLSTLTEILGLSPATKVIVVTGNNDRDAAVQAIGLGAYDFYLKPFDEEILKLVVNRAFRVRELERENQRLLAIGQNAVFEGIIGASEAITAVNRLVEKVAPVDASVLILGESGTGKELVARAIHNLSGRRDGPFVAINCAAIPENLLESELFGYEKGAFTGAVRQTLGKIERAQGGTLFLDEIGDLPQPLQAKLLRFIQERKIERIGGRQEIDVDVRIVSATHRDLKTFIQEGGFREDLYYRLSEVVIHLPPLRERSGDIILLGKYFLQKYASEYKKKVGGFSREAIQSMEAYAWPGNVRELENKIKRAVIMADAGIIDADDLELESGRVDLPFNLREVRANAEREAIVRALAYTDKNIAKAAELLGVSRPTLYDLMKKLHISTTD